jgi:dihydroflavonol-4-reductase
MVKALVTGASGFIGAHVAAALAARGDQLTCLVRKTSQVDHLQALGARLVFGDVADPDSLPAAVAGQQVVYHVAGCTRALTNWQFYEVNGRGMAHIAKACAALETPPVLICVSSLAAAGPAIEGRPRVESDLPAPVSHYGRSKRLGERAVESLAHRVPITIVRPPIVLGQHDRWGLPLFRSIIRLGIHLSPGWKPQRFSVIHAEDLAHLLILAAEQGRRLPPASQCGGSVGQGYYFAACEQDPTYPELGRLVAQSAGRRVLVIPAGMRIVRTVAAASEVISRLRRKLASINLDKAREIAAGSWVCSAQVAKTELGFEVGAPLIERMRQTVEWYRQEGWL